MTTKYFEEDDGLLVSMYFKNPPGRLLRRQWSNKVNVFPDFTDWKELVKNGDAKLDTKFLDISPDKAGILKSNTKFCFPSDNSIIRVDKYNICQKRLGES